MLIALDYDKTYTADPELWSEFVDLARSRGHDVKICTMRHPHEALPDIGLEIIYTGRQAKSKVMVADIWIDDSPHWIFEDSL